jgi:hypothetical protein
MPNGLPFKLADDLELVDWTGSILRDDKRGAIPESQFKSLVGTSYHIKQACEQRGKQWVHGIREKQQEKNNKDRHS